MRILFVYSAFSRFVYDDLTILRKHFDVKLLKLETFLIPRRGRSYKEFFMLVKNIIGCDVVFTWWATLNAFFIVLFCKLLRKKSVVAVGGYEIAYLPEIGYGNMISPIKRLITKTALRNADKVLVLSKSSLKEVLRLTHSNVRIVYAGVDLDRFVPKGDKENMVLTVGYVTRKRPDLFVKVAEKLPHVRFVIVGKYNGYKSKNVTTAENAGFAGVDSELLSLYQRAKVYCQLSAHEGFGISLAEAMACDCIPVVSNRYALPEVVGDAGFVVDYEDIKETVKAVSKALSIESKKPRERITKNFSLKRREFMLSKILRSMN